MRLMKVSGFAIDHKNCIVLYLKRKVSSNNKPFNLAKTDSICRQINCFLHLSLKKHIIPSFPSNEQPHPIPSLEDI